MRTLNFAMFAAFLLISCGGGDSPSAEESETETEGEGEEGEGGREGEGEGEGEGESESESECIREDCDDGVECTDDRWNEQNCACLHTIVPARCEPGEYCDPIKGCIEAPPCETAEDCPDLGSEDGLCLVEGCDLATSSCTYALFDRDGDGHAPRRCKEEGGDDCDDTPPPEGRCEGEENEWPENPACNGRYVYAGASELCDGRDNDCNGEVDDGIPGIGTPCDGWDDADLCEEGVWECACYSWNDDGTCGDDGYVMTCSDDAVSHDEICDGEDNDCDGEVDEGLLNACGECGPAPVEVCNGRDDDCDEEVDEGLFNACGECGPTPVEVCNGEDDDCDGEVDENPEEICDDDNPCTRDVCDGDCVFSLPALCDEIFSFECCRESADECRWYMGDSGFCGSRADPPCERLDWNWCRDIAECAWVPPFDCVRVYCGNGFCDSSESCETCASDCGACPFCGDGWCDDPEFCHTCPEDCGECFCGDSTCDPSEFCHTCPEDCGECFCGDGTCSESCDTCAEDCGECDCTGECTALEWFCCEPREDCRWYMGAAGWCGNADNVPCSEFDPTWCALYPECRWYMGDDGFCSPRGEEVPCNEFGADWCSEYEDCRWTGSACVDAGRCGDSSCNIEEGESCDSCPDDCGSCCGNGICDPSESCETCAGDCGGPCVTSCDEVIDATANINGEPLTGSTVGRTNDLRAQCQSNNNSPEQVFSVTPAEDMRIIADTAGSDYDTILSVRTDCEDPGSEIACNDDAPDLVLQSRVDFDATAGVTYFIIVEGWATAAGNYILNLRQ